MDLSEKIFKSLYNWIADKKSNIRHKVSGTEIQLEDIKAHLCILAQSLTGSAIEIFPSLEEGGYYDKIFLLPQSYDRASDPQKNLEFYVFRIVYLSELKNRNSDSKNLKNLSNHELKTSSQSIFYEHIDYLKSLYPNINSLIESVIQQEKNFQGKNEISQEIELDLTFLAGRFYSPKHPEIFNRNFDQKALPQATENKNLTELQGPLIEEKETLKVDRKAVSDYTLNHNFEKIETLEEFQGNWRDLDGSDDLAEHHQAINELNLKHTIRDDDPVHSVLNTDVPNNSSYLEVDSKEEVQEKCFTYPEWDYQKHLYKKNHCKVYYKKVNRSQIGFYKETIEQYHHEISRIKQRFFRFLNKLEQKKYQKDGADFDLDSLVQFHTDIAIGQTPSEDIFVNQRRSKRELSVLILLDLSLSTDGYVQNKKIIETEKQAAIIFGEVLKDYGDRFQIDGFSSHTRNQCNYQTIKGFDVPWEKAKHYLGEIQSEGYTRIGPAIRHAKTMLDKENAKSRWIILISDGKPNDYDRYEGRYGVEDVRKALHECEHAGIKAFSIAIDPKARFFLPQMFGLGSYSIIPNPGKLADSLADFYLRLIH